MGIDYVLNYEFKDKDEVIEIVGKSVHAQVAETGINAKLYDDLNRLIKALEIYLYQYVNKINCEKNYQIYKK